MATQVVLVCDFPVGNGKLCGKPAEPVTIRASRGNVVVDWCPQHEGLLTQDGRKPKRGRRPANGVTTIRGSRKSTAKKATARRGGPRKSKAA